MVQRWGTLATTKTIWWSTMSWTDLCIIQNVKCIGQLCIKCNFIIIFLLTKPVYLQRPIVSAKRTVVLRRLTSFRNKWCHLVNFSSELVVLTNNVWLFILPAAVNPFHVSQLWITPILFYILFCLEFEVWNCSNVYLYLYLLHLHPGFYS